LADKYWFEEHKSDQAICEYKEALRIDADYALARSNLGSLYLQEDRVEEAIAEFQEVLRRGVPSTVIGYNTETWLREAIAIRDARQTPIGDVDKVLQEYITELGGPCNRLSAIYEKMKEIGRPAIDALLAAIQTNNSVLTNRAFELLGEIGDARVVEPLSKASNILEKEFRAMTGDTGPTRTVNLSGKKVDVKVSDLLEEYRKRAKEALDKIEQPKTEGQGEGNAALEAQSTEASAVGSGAGGTAPLDPDTVAMIVRATAPDNLNPARANKVMELGSEAVPALIHVFEHPRQPGNVGGAACDQGLLAVALLSHACNGNERAAAFLRTIAEGKIQVYDFGGQRAFTLARDFVSEKARPASEPAKEPDRSLRPTEDAISATPLDDLAAAAAKSSHTGSKRADPPTKRKDHPLRMVVFAGGMTCLGVVGLAIIPMGEGLEMVALSAFTFSFAGPIMLVVGLVLWAIERWPRRR